MRTSSIIFSGLILFIMLCSSLPAQHITGRKYLRIGELWHEDEDIPGGGWHASFTWPGNHWRVKWYGENHLMNGTCRECGLGRLKNRGTR